MNMLPDGIQPIYAIYNNHFLLKDGKPKLIGKTYHGKRLLSNGSASFVDVLEFHFGDSRITDIFFFEDEVLVFHSISLYTESFITDCYKDLLEDIKTPPVAYIASITEKYSLKELGF